jgi:hypothetical protein
MNNRISPTRYLYCVFDYVVATGVLRPQTSLKNTVEAVELQERSHDRDDHDFTVTAASISKVIIF